MYDGMYEDILYLILTKIWITKIKKMDTKLMDYDFSAAAL